MTLCPCGTSLDYNDCCGPYLAGNKKTLTAESTMRARYSAFVEGNIDYIKSTHDPERRADFNEDDVKDWSLKSKWLGLEVIEILEGTVNDLSGTVEFIAKYEINGVSHAHHELGEFSKKDGEWYFMDGKILRNTVKRVAPKTGRNDPCPCGSGKKYKKCCLKG